MLDYCLHVGSENVVLYAKENAYVVKTLREFQHIDDSGKDVGGNGELEIYTERVVHLVAKLVYSHLVRQKAKDITNLLADDARLREERRSRTQMRDRMAGVDNIMADFQGPRDRSPTYERAAYLDDDRDLRRALDESKRLADESSRKNNTEYVRFYL